MIPVNMYSMLPHANLIVSLTFNLISKLLTLTIYTLTLFTKHIIKMNTSNLRSIQPIWIVINRALQPLENSDQTHRSFYFLLSVN